MTTHHPRRSATEHASTRAERSRLTHLLVATGLGVYLLVVVGAATSLLDGASACGTWPTCGGAWLPARAEPGLLAAWSHRVATLAVGGLLATTAWRTWRTDPLRRVRAAVGVAAVLYPVQMVLGALTATTGPPTGVVSAHLVVGVGIFSGCLLALLWQLEDDAPGAREDGRRDVDAGTETPDAPDAPDTPSTDGREPDGRPAPREPDPTGRPSTENSDPVGRPSTGVRGRASAYLRLTKPRLWWLLCLVALAAMGLAAGPTLDPGLVVATLGGGVLAIAASGTFNNVLERDVDRRMARTGDRPLVSGQIPVRRAVAFGVALAVASVAVLLTFVNPLAAALGLLAILFYSIVYTLLLKPNTDQNIVIGGAVGAFPALIGWAAVTGTVGVPALVLGAVVFLWTPAHFYNLALAYRDDYARAGFPMLPVVRGAGTTRRHVLLYFGATMVAAVALGTAELLGWLYAGAVVVVAGVFLCELVRQYRSPSDRTAFRTFHASNAYLGVLLAAVLVDAMAL